MSFDPLRHRPRLRRALPWVLWSLAAGVVVAGRGELSWTSVSPAVAEAHVVGVTAPRRARVVQVLRQRGEVVAAGDALVVLSAPELDAELAVARAELVALESEVGAVSADVREADREALARLGQDVERAAVDVARYRADLEALRVEQRAVESLIARQADLVSKGIATTAEREALELKRASLDERARTSQALVDAAVAHEERARARLTEFVAERRRRPSGGADVEERVAPASAKVRAQEARIAALERAAAALTLTAPVAGRVVDVSATVGADVEAGAVVAYVVADGPADIVVYVDETAARTVVVGQAVELTPIDRASGARRGRVRALAPAIVEMPARFRPIPTQPSFGRAVVVDLVDEGPAPLPGMAFHARLGAAP